MHPRTSANRLLLDQAYTNLRKGVEQIFTICELTQNNNTDPIITERQRITTRHTNTNNLSQPIPPRIICQLTIKTIKNTISRTTAIIKYSQQHQQHPDQEQTQHTHTAHRAIHKIAPQLIHLSTLLEKNFSQKKAKRKLQMQAMHPHTYPTAPPTHCNQHPNTTEQPTPYRN